MDDAKAKEILNECGWGSAIIPCDNDAAKKLYKVAILAVRRSYDLGVHDEALSNAQDAAGASL